VSVQLLLKATNGCQSRFSGSPVTQSFQVVVILNTCTFCRSMWESKTTEAHDKNVNLCLSMPWRRIGGVELIVPLFLMPGSHGAWTTRVNHTGVLTRVASTLGGKREQFTRTKGFSTIVTMDGTVAEGSVFYVSLAHKIPISGLLLSDSMNFSSF
jgi:hypothetical protein